MFRFIGIFAISCLIVGIQSGGDEVRDPKVICPYSYDVGYICNRNPPSELWAYNNEIGYCESFIYLGCGGNGNRFVHPADCETFCRIMGDARPNETLASWESTSQLPSESVYYDG